MASTGTGVPAAIGAVSPALLSFVPSSDEFLLVLYLSAFDFVLFAYE